MNVQSQSPITIRGMQKIKEELDRLIKTDREEIKKSIQSARELGDLKENAEYHAAKEKQSMIEGRISKLQGVVAKSRVVDTGSILSDKIVFGATVKLYDVIKGKSSIYQIVGEEEADTSKGLISYLSPLGRSLIGKEGGDVVVVKVPKGEVEYEIESFEYK